jgi:hypothetical protein
MKVLAFELIIVHMQASLKLNRVKISNKAVGQEKKSHVNKRQQTTKQRNRK